MNENEKLPLNTEEPLKKDVSAQEADPTVKIEESTAETCSDECALDSSPSMDLAEAADRISEEEEETQTKEPEAEVKEKEECDDACAIESSPSLDLAAFADEETAEEENEEKVQEKSFHQMSKEELLDALTKIVDNAEWERHKEVTAIKQAYYAILNAAREKEQEEFIAAGNDIGAFSYSPDETEEVFKNLMAEFKEKRNEFLEAREELRKKNLADKYEIIEKIKNISEDIDTINQQFPTFQQLQQEFKAAGEVPQGSEVELWKNYQLAVEQFYDRLKVNKELRDLDFKKNFELKSQLIEKAQGLAEVADVLEAFRTLQGLHEQWREIGPVARDVREEMWNKFKEASTVVNKRHQDFFQNKKENEQANETAKTELCEKVEAIDMENFKSYSDWDEATKQILDLQAAWKELGFASRKVNNALFARFRSACDKFFTAKADYFKKMKEESRDNLQKKEALCEKAEALAADFERKGALDEMQALQKEWREIGVVRRKQGDEVWKRFCNALDEFYGNRKKLFSGKKAEEAANLKAKQDIIAKLKEISEEEDRNDVISTIRELQAEWQNVGHVPFKDKDEVNQAYRAELDRLFGAFDIRETRQRVRRYENDIKKFAAEEGRMSRERDKLVRALESRISEAKTIENNLGFFNVKSNAGNSMVKEMEKKIQKLKAEAEEIKEKIALLDAQEKA
ncbi:MAG: DUF349 domain-containing protein [Muribaculaceae bacterium]|nr:DUF349 domain-containing protein [Muribaculaceae bacterium]